MSTATAIPLITLEEHFTSGAIAAETRAQGQDQLASMPADILTRLSDVSTLRLASMDVSDVAIQVLSHTPEQRNSTAAIIASNDELAAAVAAHPARLRAFANLPMADAAAAALELRRCMQRPGFVGALVNNHADGTWYDGPAYDVFWAAAQELGAPVYLHPNWPSDDMRRVLYAGGGLEGRELETAALGAFAFGWHAETGLHVMRLLAARVFERFPRLKVVIGHSGELLPYMFPRIKNVGRMFGLQRGFEQIMRENVWITTSGMFDLPSLKLLLAHMPLDRVMLSVDYPFSSNEMGRKFVEEIESSGTLVGDDLKAFAHGNAMKLLGLELPSR